MGTDKVFFRQGDLVKVRQDLPNRPVMVVEKLVKADVKSTGALETYHSAPTDPGIPKLKSRPLQGVLCFWFDSNFRIQEREFNFKDLEAV